MFQAEIETHLILNRADDIPLDQAGNSTSTRELIDMYQISFVYILRYRVLECSMH